MPCTKKLDIDTSKPVLVTGATGYVAGVLISQLLDAGVTVHATVRDPSKKDRIQYLQDVADKSRGSIKFFAADLLKKGSFDEAAAGCSIIFHTASPFVMNVEDPDKDLIEPAVHGTENVLIAASKTPSVKRVVLTSSCAAIYSNAIDLQDTPGHVWTEEIWNRTSTRTDNAYSLSKTMAEQKAWVMAGSQTQYKLVVINPAMVMGPGLMYHATSESYRMLVQLGGGDMASGAPDFPLGVVDVRDVAAAHIAAAYLPDAAGRHVCCGSNTSFPEMAAALASKYAPPKYPVPTKKLPMPKVFLWLIAPFVEGPITRSFVSKNMGYHMNFDNSKSKTELGMDYYPLEKTMQDMYQQLLDLKEIVPKE